ncbi:hypothetical protein BGX38DRAFT_1261768 [Terfezia claveryi]|nr:hypothetical protein BGX38DRAFT_1316304 [Terfezia claveryi]KAF8439652.1 hypothetical protein BGX38DRAFT_1261768 [Terfezia claveryi]
MNSLLVLILCLPNLCTHRTPTTATTKPSTPAPSEATKPPVPTSTPATGPPLQPQFHLDRCRLPNKHRPTDDRPLPLFGNRPYLEELLASANNLAFNPPCDVYKAARSFGEETYQTLERQIKQQIEDEDSSADDDDDDDVPVTDTGTQTIEEEVLQVDAASQTHPPIPTPARTYAEAATQATVTISPPPVKTSPPNGKGKGKLR